MRYYATAEEAASAGYRPCLRCRPEAAPGSPAWTGTSAVVQRALRLIQDGALDHASLSDLATRLGVGVRHLSRLFARHVGASPATVAQTRRIYFAKRLLDDTPLPITDIAHAAGFGSIRRFNDAFRKTYRKAPRELRRERRVGIDKTEGAEIALRLAYRPPYDWHHIQSFLAANAMPGVEDITADAYSRAAPTPSGYSVLRVQPVPNANALEVRIKGALPAELPRLLSSVRRMFDLTADPRHIGTAMTNDTLLMPLLARRPGLRIAGAWDPFECCVSAILGASGGGDAARRVLTRLIERFGNPIDVPGTDIRYTFPNAGMLAEADLGDLGLSSARRAALQLLARGVRDKLIRFDAASEEIRRMLCSLPGVGRWTAGYVALRGLGEPDAFPSGDLVLRRVAACGYNPLTTRALEERAERWRPFRGYAVFYLWDAAG